MHFASRNTPGMFALLAAGLSLLAAPASAVVITLKSGNAAPGNPDPLITYVDLATSCGLGYPTAFTAAEFTAALAGPQATVIGFPHPAWQTSIPCDPSAAWVGRDNFGTPMSALYAMEFDLGDPCCFTKATLDFCWGVDDALGDAINPAGIYLNGTPLAAVQGGSLASQTEVNGMDVTSLVHCGRNTLHIYDRDLGCVISGIIFSAKLDVTECIVQAHSSSWGKVKAIYR